MKKVNVGEVSIMMKGRIELNAYIYVHGQV